MGVLLLGFGMAAVSYFFKPIGIAIILISLIPLLITFISAPVNVMIDPSSVNQVTSNVTSATTNYLAGDLILYPGAALFGALAGLFIPSEGQG
jgi:hypothetical protein